MLFVTLLVAVHGEQIVVLVVLVVAVVVVVVQNVSVFCCCLYQQHRQLRLQVTLLLLFICEISEAIN